VVLKKAPVITPAPVQVDKPVEPRIYLIQVLNGSKKTEEKFSDPAKQ
jgi:hypothetical protein